MKLWQIHSHQLWWMILSGMNSDLQAEVRLHWCFIPPFLLLSCGTWSACASAQTQTSGRTLYLCCRSPSRCTCGPPAPELHCHALPCSAWRPQTARGQHRLVLQTGLTGLHLDRRKPQRLAQVGRGAPASGRPPFSLLQKSLVVRRWWGLESVWGVAAITLKIERRPTLTRLQLSFFNSTGLHSSFSLSGNGVQ